MWGSVTPNTDTICDWEHAPFNGGNTSYNAGAFNQVKDTACPNGILAKDYDAAAQIMGGDWRMPTKDELNELYQYTNTERITDSNSNFLGFKFISTKDTSKYIFIPKSGYRSGSSFYDQGTDGNIGLGHIWSSSLHPTYNYAWEMSIYVDRINPSAANTRLYGLPVRGVHE